jgi:XisH protein
MAARDRYHDWVKDTLVNAGWVISHDPLSIRIGKIGIQIDLGLENLIGAEKDTQKSLLKSKDLSILLKLQISMRPSVNTFAIKLH